MSSLRLLFLLWSGLAQHLIEIIRMTEQQGESVCEWLCVRACVCVCVCLCVYVHMVCACVCVRVNAFLVTFSGASGL